MSEEKVLVRFPNGTVSAITSVIAERLIRKKQAVEVSRREGEEAVREQTKGAEPSSSGAPRLRRNK